MKRLKFSLPSQIITGLALGVFAGFFFGDMVSWLQPIGEIFIMLLKMSILPYIVVALIHGLGSLKPYQAVRIVKFGGFFMVLIWIITIATMYAMTLIFPEENPVFVHGNPVGTTMKVDAYLKLFIPSNPFHALANNMVPAVVIFSLFFGAGLMLVKKEVKQGFLESLDVASRVLSQITRWVILISPIGVFALVASTLGTVSVEQLAKLALYLVGFLLATLFLTFWALPALVTSTTEIKFREILRDFQPPLLLAFSTGNIFVAIPYLMLSFDRLSEDHAFFTEESKPVARTLVPISYDLPLVGNLMAIYFVLFIGYYYAVDFHWNDQLHIMLLSIFTLAGPVTAGLNSISFLIDALHLPTDAVALFAETFSITRNLQALAGTMGISVFTILTLCAFTRRLKVRWNKVLINLIVAIVLLAGTVFAARQLVPKPAPQDPIFSRLSIATEVPTTVYKRRDKVPAPPKKEAGETSFDVIRRTGQIRLGYNGDSMPFTYFNREGQLVGFDVALALDFAKVLDLKVVFIPFEYSELESDLDSGLYDAAVTAVNVTFTRLREMAFTTPLNYLEAAFIVPDYLRNDFTNLNEVKEMDGLRIGVLGGSSMEELGRKEFPNATIVPLKSYDVGVNNPKIDVMLWTNKEGYTWALRHPNYTIVVPYPAISKGFYAFALNVDSEELLEQFNYWIVLREKDGYIKAQEEKWIEGKVGEPPPRWSIIRNVLHWVQ